MNPTEQPTDPQSHAPTPLPEPFMPAPAPQPNVPPTFMPADTPMQPPTAPQPPVMPAYNPIAPSGSPAPPPFAPQYPQAQVHTYSQQPAHKGPNRQMIIVAAIVAAVLLVGATGYFFLVKGGNPISTITNLVTGGGDVVDRSDGTLDLGTLIDQQDTIKEQSLKAKLNQQVNLSDGTSYMVTKVERNYASTSPLLRLDKGKEFVRVSIVVGNKNKAQSTYISSAFLKLKNSAGGLVTSEYVTSDDIASAYDSQDVAPGKQVKGDLIFQVDQNEKIQGFATSDKYENFTTKQEVTVASDISL